LVYLGNGRRAQRRNKLEADMRVGIARGQFLPFYQPQVDLVSGKLHGFEVLARWEHPERGLVEPTSFIPIAEATGMIGSLSFSVMKQALLETLDWDPKLLIAMNLSPVQLKDPLLAQRIVKLLAETRFPPSDWSLKSPRVPFLTIWTWRYPQSRA
jgi:EAL domain-containing protein (putative c-di-GMP-specific phosphodiesterase class I)